MNKKMNDNSMEHVQQRPFSFTQEYGEYPVWTSSKNL